MSLHTATAAMTEILPAEPPEWVMLMPAGLVELNDGRGPFHADAAAVAAATRQRLGGRHMPLDFDHSETRPAAVRTGAPVPAAGWVTELEARADGVWGRVQWTEAGAEAIRSRAYLYISPFFAFRPDRRVVAIINAGLVKSPAIDMARLAAAQDLHTKETDMDLEQELRTALGLPDDADGAAIVAAVSHGASLLRAASGGNALPAMLDDLIRSTGATTAQLGEAAGIEAGTVSQILRGEITCPPMERLQGFARVLGVPVRRLVEAARTDGCPFEDEAAARTVTASPDPAQFVPMAQFVELRDSLAALQAERAQERAERAVAAASEAGKIAPAQREWALAYAQRDPTGFEDYVAAAPVIAAAAVLTGRQPPGGGGALTPFEESVRQSLGLSTDEWLAARPKA